MLAEMNVCGESLLKELRMFEKRVWLGNDESLIDNMSKLWSYISGIKQVEVIEILKRSPEFERLQKALRPPWHRYIKALEIRQSIDFLSDAKLQSESVLALEDYKGVNAELDLLEDVPASANVAVLGCGPFPETLLALANSRFQFKRIVGVDRDPIAVSISNNVVSKALPNAENEVVSICADAETMDYFNFDLIFIANGICNKGGLVQAISNTASKKVQILTRNPILLGHLFYEHILESDLESKLEIRKSTQASRLSETSLITLLDLK